MKVNLTSFGLAQSESKESEDSLGCNQWDETAIAVLADGTGRACGAREAAQRIVSTLVNNYQARPKSWTPQKALLEFTTLLNRTLYQESLARYEGPEMVSTLCVAVIEGNKLFGLNVGDSRVYLSRGGELKQLSVDHVLAEAAYRHVLQRAMGLAAEVEPHCFTSDLLDGDIVLLCSDGVSNVLPDSVLAEKLSHRTAARALVQSARDQAKAETLDDMSAIVMEVVRTGRLAATSALPLPVPGPLSKGMNIDGYELIRSFQQSDRVWLASRDGARWTLKFAPLEARDDEATLNLFIKETWNATRLDAPFFVRALVPENASMRYYVMEFVEAPCLKTLLRSRHLAIDEAISLAKFLIEASAHLLRLDLVHGDIKPENILVSNEYDGLRFKLVDLGSATEIFSVTSRAGTASYLAPERFESAPISERTEIFAIGATLFQALTGTLPYGEIERFQTPHFTPGKRPSRLNPNMPRWLESVLLRATAIEPRRRYQHYSEIAFDLTNPAKVEPFYLPGQPLFERDPALFYKIGFWVFLATTIYLLSRIYTQR